MIPKGVIPPVLTPLKENNEIDLTAFKQLLNKLINSGVHALFVAGTAGLGSIMTEAQYEETIATAIEHTAGRLPVLAGVLESSTARSIERLKKLEHSGVKAAVVVSPYYCRAQNDSQLLRHFGLLREATDLELVVYNLPGCTGTIIPVKLICEMAKRNWIHACKDSSGDSEYFLELCRRGSKHGLQVYQGMRPDFEQLGKLRAAGCVPVPGNVFPELFVNAWNKRLQHETLSAIQQQCDEVWNQLVVGTDFFSRSIKLLAEQGIGSGIMPEPFTTRTQNLQKEAGFMI